MHLLMKSPNRICIIGAIFLLFGAFSLFADIPTATWRGQVFKTFPSDHTIAFYAIPARETVLKVNFQEKNDTIYLEKTDIKAPYGYYAIYVNNEDFTSTWLNTAYVFRKIKKSPDADHYKITCWVYEWSEDSSNPKSSKNKLSRHKEVIDVTYDADAEIVSISIPGWDEITKSYTKIARDDHVPYCTIDFSTP